MSYSEAVYSNDYYDFISGHTGVEIPVTQEALRIPLLGDYSLVYETKEGLPELNVSNYTYNSIPNCFTLMSQQALDASGILKVQNQPALTLRGRGILIGFVDTGIDYTADAFRYSDGSTRILSIWDQSQTTGETPEGFPYGSEYSEEDINAALDLEDPYEAVAQRDENGHGTFLAGIAAGTADRNGSFTGAAPLASIAMVKLKQAKEYLREFYFIPEAVEAYEETDLMAGITYLERLAKRKGLPLVICIGIGSNMGNHGGDGPLATMLSDISAERRRVVVAAAGNEAVQRHHFYGTVTEEENRELVEINVDENVNGFFLELWARAPELYSVSVISPTGEKLPPYPSRAEGHREYTFLFEGTRISLDYREVGVTRGNELVYLRFINPVRGLWTLEVKAETVLDGHYHVWLPVQQFLSGDVFFIKSNPDVTITNPSSAAQLITVGAYDASNGSLYLRSGRGYNFYGTVKPELTAPGVEVSGSGRGNRTETMTGTSVSAAVTAGAAALFMELAIRTDPDSNVNTAIVKNAFERGATRSAQRLYPDHAWGYGTLELYNAMQSANFY